MPLPTNFVVATLRYGSGGNPAQLNVLWYDLTGTVGEPTPDDDANMIATAIASHFNDELSAVMTTETDLRGVVATCDFAGSVFTAGQPFTALAGDITGDTLPEFCAVVIQKRTAQPGRAGRGRWYIGCVPESFTDNGETTLSADAAYDALKTKLISPVTAGGATLTPVLYSKSINTTFPLTSAKVNSALGTERRRLVRPLI